jgi:uncharacterized spore protein YtfJ
METSTTIDEIAHRLSLIGEEMGASACFGTPIERNGHTIVPVARVSFGYGVGFGRGSGGDAMTKDGSDGGSGEGEGGGGGGGGSSTPVAVVDISSEGVSIQPVNDSTRIALTVFLMVAWNAFWMFWTVRSVFREGAKTRRLKLEKGLG